MHGMGYAESQSGLRFSSFVHMSHMSGNVRMTLLEDALVLQIFRLMAFCLQLVALHFRAS